MDVHFLTKGSHVEVSTAEEGFGSVWFEATVVSPPPSTRKKKTHKDKVCVEYKTLCSDHDLSVPLREFVDVGCVRPLPPVSDDDTRLFEVYDMVDAWYQDGWWSGVITRVFEGLRFLVTFQNPPDELEFRGSELRLHVEWVNDSWVQPPKQKVPGLMFGEGKDVEVSINIKHNHGVWYPATVVENHADSSFLVEYKVLKEGTNQTEPRKLTVDCSHIRPSPPPLKNRCFGLLDKVDAFHELGWWAGLVTKELPDNRYIVFFQSTKKVGEFDLTDVRPQLNWKDGKWWFTSSQEEVTPCQENCGVHIDNELNDISSGRTIRTSKTKVSLKGKKMKQKACISRSSRESNPLEILGNSPCTPKGALAGTNLEEREFPSTSLIKNQTGRVDMVHEKSHGIASSPKKGKHTSKINMQLVKKLKRGGGAVTPSTSSQQKTTVSDKQIGEINFTSGSPPSNTPGDNMLIDLTSADDEFSDFPSWGTRTAKRRKKIDAKENHKLRSGRKQGQAGEESNDGLPKGDEHVELHSGGEKANAVLILGLECSKLSGSKAGKSCLNNDEKCLKLDWDQKKQLHNLPQQHKEDQSEAGTSSQKRKRGRPPKVSRASPNAEMKEQNRITAYDDIIINDFSMSEVDLHVTPDSMLISTGGLLPAENSLMPIGDCVKLACADLNCRNDSGSTTRNSSLKPTDCNDQDLISEHQRQMSKKAKRRATSENKISQISDSSDSTMAKTAEPICITKEVIRTLQQEHGMLDDQSLSTWVEKTQTSDPVNSSTQGASTTMMVEQSMESRHTRKELNGQNTFIEDNKTAAVMSEEVDAHNCVRVDSDKVVGQFVELRQTRKELNGQTTFIEDNKTAAVMSGEVDAHNCVLVDGDIVVEQLVESGKELNGQTTSVKVNKTVPFMGEKADGRSLALVDCGTSITTTGEPELPFVKCSSLWKAVESMEAFCKMPQKPHFRPLLQYKESLREGFAIAFMVNFSSVVEKISMLQFDDTKEKINDILDSLKDLESHGFDVQVLLDRVTQLELIKEGHRKLFEEVDALNKQIVSSTFDKFGYDKEIIEVSKQIKELQSRKTRLEILKVAADDELELLESRLGDAEEAIESARSRYEGLASEVLRLSF